MRLGGRQEGLHQAWKRSFTAGLNRKVMPFEFCEPELTSY
ncbi:MAG: hypothetical protein ACI9DF_004865 [Verrucomicrobiales bacterium]|jgi:hypothetical protein